MTIHAIAPVLALILTLLGVTLSLGVLLLLGVGSQVAGEGRQRHRIAYGKLSIQTDRVVMLLITSLFAAAIPLLGYYWLSARGFEQAQLYLVATIEDGPATPIRQGEATFVRIEGGKALEQCIERDLSATNGEFTCQASLKSVNDIFELRVKKPGGGGGIRPIKLTEHRVLMTLTGERR